jgi:RHS repeat-associated protein
MQLGPSPQIPDGLMAARSQLSEKPHQGFATKKSGLHPASNVPNFRVTLGLQAILIENGVRKTYSARYYNPQTGRFLSRDPEDGNAKDPQSLHKYLYAGGDPVNRIDPHGRGALLEYAIIATFLIQEYEPEILKVAKMGCSLLEFVDKVLTYIDFIKAVKNGPTENGVGDLSYFFFQAELACKSL